MALHRTHGTRRTHRICRTRKIYRIRRIYRPRRTCRTRKTMRVGPSENLFLHLPPHPALLRRWKCPSRLRRPWTCLIEDSRNCRWESVAHQPGDNTGADVAANAPHCYFFLLFVEYSILLQQDGMQTSMGPMNSSVDLWASTLSFLATISVTLVLRCKRPGLWSRTKEHP